MKAMTLKQFGGVENFVLEDLPTPEPKAEEVQIQVMSIGINPIDIKTRQGSGMASSFEGHRPMILGWDVSGVVTKVGEGVKEFHIGDEVFGTINFPGIGAAYAEYTLAPADQIARKPVNISHTEAAGATLSALTAWQALVDTGHVKKGDKVLIHGATGGVGSYATQIAKHLGCYVVGTASGATIDYAKQLGADQVIDYKTQRFEEITGDFDFILESIGGENFVRSLMVLKPEGTIVLLPSNKKAEAEKEVEKQHVKHFHHIVMHSSGEEMRQIADMLAEGSMHVNVDKIFGFDEIPQAHTALENGHVKGKIVVNL